MINKNSIILITKGDSNDKENKTMVPRLETKKKTQEKTRRIKETRPFHI